MKRIYSLLPYAGLFFVFALTTAFKEGDALKTAHYVQASAVDLKAILPDPPKDDSAQTKAEIETVLAKQKTRTPEEVARTQSEVKLTPYAFANVLGPWFKPENLPLTDKFLKNVEEDVHAISESAKVLWNRSRPPVLDKRVQPAVEVPKSASYPSGHATRAMVWGLILAELAPDLKTKLLARAEQIGDDRILGGVHYPSDDIAGQTLGKALVQRMLAEPVFQSELAKSKAEFAKLRR